MSVGVGLRGCGLNFSEQPPSKQWAALKYRGEKFAEVWFKPEGEPFALTFRIPQSSFHIPGMDQLLTAENLLKAVGITAEEVESWHHEGASPSGTNGPDSDLGRPLPTIQQGMNPRQREHRASILDHALGESVRLRCRSTHDQQEAPRKVPEAIRRPQHACPHRHVGGPRRGTFGPEPVS